MEDISKIHRGITFQEDQFGDLLMCIHPETAQRFLKTLVTNPKGWARFKIRKRSHPTGRITHGFEQIGIYREVKPEVPEENKEWRA